MQLMEGLPYLSGESPRVLILGSFPGTRSLETGEYYANPRNQFWRIIESIWEISSVLPYIERIEEIKSAGIALWDVIQSCERHGAMDCRIRNVHVNDIAGVIKAYPSIQLVIANGRTAERYLSKAWPRGFPGVVVGVFPSTSPANARMSFEEKVRAWNRISELS
jgi:TDG/mug DNA glycosylase family protein